MNRQDDCFLCTLPPERIMDECDLTYTIRDGFAVSPGHTLILTKRHAPTFFDLTLEEQAAISAAIQKAKQVLDAEFNPDGYNIGINNGEFAGQSIPHLHVHLIPRYQGDVENPKGGVRWVVPQNADYWTKRD
ncbi:MAG: HIT family protein [Gammaproteobacteria bacterium]|jgi:diadenosine tetraphosphate (Ap4A) HIT family hydrolase|nr:HIT family protein [Gammaproteobacteria bacterium]MBT4608228.1 HIT family protein [Thiotrichales bacterium]MBT3471275.1 HIT family protein [Gammaproteobacteria bacterium]MBT3966058.1 HIT family protein [Gammaproteobacteria bacterium]MBT4080035.1 HIT family protein [Gammaproteobacteria bacterium]